MGKIGLNVFRSTETQGKNLSATQFKDHKDGQRQKNFDGIKKSALHTASQVSVGTGPDSPGAVARIVNVAGDIASRFL